VGAVSSKAQVVQSPPFVPIVLQKREGEEMGREERGWEGGMSKEGVNGFDLLRARMIG